MTQWTDQSSRGNNLLQTSGNMKPTYLQNDLNFNPSISFDGNDDNLMDVDGLFGNNTYENVQIFVVQKVKSVDHQTLFWEQGSDGRVSTHLPSNDIGPSTAYWDVGDLSGTGGRLSGDWSYQTNIYGLWTLSSRAVVNS